MADVSTHPQGQFCWVELATSDQKGGAAFYRDLFGWTVNEQPIGPTETYTMFKLRGQDAAAAYTLGEEERKMHIPPHWNNYIAVASADDAAKKTQELGGNVLVPPFDVMEHGRMAVLQDPTGAVFQVWQPKQHKGIGVSNEPGALCWTELTTTDTKAAEHFYTKLFGWTPKHSAPSAQMEYTEFSLNGTPSIGMMPKPKEMPAEIPSYWMPYFQVASVDSSAAKAKSLGANVMVGPQDIPNTGRFAIINDPQHAVFAIFERKS